MGRRSIYIPGFKHRNPIPNAAVIGNVLESGVITGVDPETGEMAAGIEAQCANAFAHMRAIVEAAGGTIDDILKVTVWLKRPNERDVLNAEWLKMFPDPETRPARHAMPGRLEGHYEIQLIVTAILNDG